MRVIVNSGRNTCVPRIKEQQIAIEDLGSTNGIVINGQRVRQATLNAGSRFEIGSTRIAITSPGADV